MTTSMLKFFADLFIFILGLVGHVVSKRKCWFNLFMEMQIIQILRRDKKQALKCLDIAPRCFSEHVELARILETEALEHHRADH